MHNSKCTEVTGHRDLNSFQSRLVSWPHKATKEPIHILHVFELADPRDVLVRPQDDSTAPRLVDAVVLVGLAVALVVGHVVNVDLPIVPPVAVIEGTEDLREVSQLRVDARSTMDSQHLDDGIDLFVSRREASDEGLWSGKPGA